MGMALPVDTTNTNSSARHGAASKNNASGSKPIRIRLSYLQRRGLCDNAAMSDSYFYQPALGHGLPHDPFNAIVGPRPIGWIASRSANGVLNLAPYSFFNA